MGILCDRTEHAHLLFPEFLCIHQYSADSGPLNQVSMWLKRLENQILLSQKERDWRKKWLFGLRGVLFLRQGRGGKGNRISL